MKDHIAYLKYVLLHKYYILKYRKLTGCSFWRALIHDFSKFNLIEWVPYVHTFYKPDGSGHYSPSMAFQLAWCHHQKVNLHHWQSWVLINDSGLQEALPMPEKYIKEMVADWIAAGLAITGKMELSSWYQRSKGNMLLHPSTRELVEELIDKAQ